MASSRWARALIPLVFMLPIVALKTGCKGPRGGGEGGLAPGAPRLSTSVAQPYKGVTLRILTSASLPELKSQRDILDPQYMKLSGVRIQYEDVAWRDLYPKIQTMCAAGGQDYDVFFIEDQWKSVFEGCTEELDHFYQSAPGDIHPEDYPLRALGTAMNKDKWTGVPGVVPLGILAYRKDLFENPRYRAEFQRRYGRELKVPETWEDYLEVGRFFTRDTDGDGKLDLWGFNHRYGEANNIVGDWYLGFAFSRGMRVFDENFNPTINTPEGIESARFFLSREFLAAQPPGVESFQFNEVMQNFVQGKVALYLTETWSIPLLLDPKSSKVADKVSFALIPGWKNPQTGEIQRATFFVGMSYAVNSHADERAKWAAWDYLQYAHGKTLDKPFALETGTTVRLSSMRDPEVVAKWPHLKAVLQAYDLPAGTRPSEPWSSQVEFAIGKELQAALVGKKSVEQALDDANEAVRKIVEEEGYYKTPHRSYSAEERIQFAADKLRELGVAAATGATDETH